MANTTFMKKKYSLEVLINHYLADIDHLKALVKVPMDEIKRQEYYRAANTFKQISTKDLVQFAVSSGKGEKSFVIKSAFSTLLGNRVAGSTTIDLEYARLLLSYAKCFKEEKKNLSNWMLHFLLNSHFSPLRAYIAAAIEQVIEDTEQKLVAYQALNL